MRLSALVFLFLACLFITLFSFSGVEAKTDHEQIVIAVIAFDTQFLDTHRGLKYELDRLGFHAGDNIRYIIHDLKKDLSSIPVLIKQLQQIKCDLILTITTPVTLAVKKALQNTDSIPVVFTMVADPVGSGVVSSLQKPGGNITGISYNAFAMMPKRLELFREAFPQMHKIAVFYNHDEAWIAAPVGNIFMPAARDLAFQVTAYDVSNQQEMIRALDNFDSQLEGIFMLPDPKAISFFDDLLWLSRRNKLPIMVLDNSLLVKGGVLGYSPSFFTIGQQTATMITKILMGTAAGSLPIQSPDMLQLIVSMREADLLGITLPVTFLRQTDEILR